MAIEASEFETGRFARPGIGADLVEKGSDGRDQGIDKQNGRLLRCDGADASTYGRLTILSGS
jgi:hypothetical protein